MARSVASMFFPAPRADRSPPDLAERTVVARESSLPAMFERDLALASKDLRASAMLESVSELILDRPLREEVRSTLTVDTLVASCDKDAARESSCGLSLLV